MELTVKQYGESATAVASLAGEVDLHSALALRGQLEALLFAQNSTIPKIILDLDGVGFLDSTGLGALVATRAAARDRNGALELVCTQQRILKLFTITGLDEVFRVHRSVDDALIITG
jgi:anti-sigma B factor antagonist